MFDAQNGRRFEKSDRECRSRVAEEGSESITVETQVLFTTAGAVRRDGFPWGIVQCR